MEKSILGFIEVDIPAFAPERNYFLNPNNVLGLFICDRADSDEKRDTALNG